MRPPDELNDGDSGFTQVNNRLHPSLLGPGVMAGAVNRTLELGDARARWAALSGVWGDVNAFSSTPLGMARWWEPATGEEALVVITGAARADGGMGRAWRLTSSTAPVEIPLNGHDIWTTGRLVPQRQALVLCRQGNTRHYFNSTAVNAGTDTITLNVTTPDIVNGDRVLFKLLDGATPPLPLQDNTNYYAAVTGNAIILHPTSALAAAINLTTAGSGSFYLERTTESPGAGGLGARPLVLEPGWSGGTTQSAWSRGFRGVPQSLSATATNTSALWEVLNHRLDAGAAVKVGANVGASFVAGTTYYAEPADPHHVYLHAAVTTALLGTSASRIVADANSTNTMTPASYSGMPMPPLREAVSYKNRIVGLNERANVAVSDPGDFLHFTPFEGALTAALGNGDALTTLCPMGEDTMLLATETNVLGIVGLASNDIADWSLLVIPGALGCIAPLTAVQIGSDAWWLSRSGVASVRQTATGFQEGVAVPTSAAIARKLNEVDWAYANQSCAAYFNNRYFCAVPLKGQEGTPVNNCLLVYNFLTQGWEGWWEGDEIEPVQFARHKVGGQERLCWLDASGSVRFFDEDGLEDITLTYSAPDYTNHVAAIETEDLTRAYTFGYPGEKQFTELELILESWAANWSLAAITDGVNEETIYRSGETKDPSKFLTHDTADYDQAAEPERATLPYREDYSVVPNEAENLIAEGAVWELAEDAVSKKYLVPVSLTIGNTYELTLGNAIALTTLEPGITWPIDTPAQTVLASGEFVAEYETYWLFAGAPAVGSAVTTTLLNLSSEEIALPDPGGLPLEAHQVYVLPIALSERDHSIQFRINNTSGSLRVRSLRVKGVPLKG
jgi:hypothetical protein